MNETVVEVFKALGYPLSSVIALVVLAYISRQFFQKILESVVARDIEDVKRQNAEKLESIKKDYSLVLEDRKSELGRETERLRASLSVEVETYRLAAVKRFESLMELWESSESLFRDTDFSSRDSINDSLDSVNKAIANLNRYSILFSEELAKYIHEYLNGVATVLTNKESDFEEGKVKSKDIAKMVAWTSEIVDSVVPFVGILGAIASEIIVSTTHKLEARRLKSAEAAREALATALRIEFGVIFAEQKPLVAALTKNQDV